MQERRIQFFCFILQIAIYVLHITLIVCSTTLYEVWRLIVSLQKSNIAQEAAKVTIKSKCGDSSVNLNVPVGRSLSITFSSSQGKSVVVVANSFSYCIFSHSLLVCTTIHRRNNFYMHLSL